MTATNHIGHFYQPLPAYPHVLKYQGIATEQNVAWVMQQPGMILLPEYMGDKITADGHRPITAGEV